MKPLTGIAAAALLWVAGTAASHGAEASAADLSPWAQPNATVSVDCRDFARMPNGAWKILRATDVGIGTAVYQTGGGGYLIRQVRQDDGTNIYGAVQRACGPAAPPSRTAG